VDGAVSAPAAGLYQFRVVTDDGAYLILNINGADLIAVDAFRDQAPTTFTSAPVYLDAAAYSIRFDYYEAGGGATARLLWKKPGDAAFSVIPPRTSTTRTGGVGSGLLGEYRANAGHLPGSSLTYLDFTQDAQSVR